MKVTISRKAHFNAAHRLYNANWDDAKNKTIFGKCANPNYHGHNYDLIVSVKGEINPETGFVMNLDELRKIIETEVEDELDHKNLNLDVAYFKTINPTAENIAVFIWNKIRSKLDRHLDLKVTLYETARNFVEYEGE